MALTARLFELVPPERHQWLVPWDLADYGRPPLAGAPSGDFGSGELSMRLLDRDDLGRPRLPSDFPWVTSSVLGLSPRAHERVGPRLAGRGVLIPVQSPDGWWLYRPQCYLDLDESRSELQRLPSGRVAIVTRYAFQGDIPDAPVLGIRQLPRGPLLMPISFVDAADALGLVGLGRREADVVPG